MLLIIQIVQVSNVKFGTDSLLNSLRKLSKPTLLYMSQNIWLESETKTTVVPFCCLPNKYLGLGGQAHLVTTPQGPGAALFTIREQREDKRHLKILRATRSF